MINWDSKPRSVTLAKGRALGSAALEAYRLGPDGGWESYRGAIGPDLRLAPQEVLVARMNGNK